MAPGTFWPGCRLALLGVALAGCAVLSPEPEPEEPPAAPPVATVPPPLPIIFFSSNGDSLDISAREKIETIASIVAAPRWADRAILVKGHSDALGSPDYNNELARRRAELVADELVFANVARDRITVQSVGADEPLAPDKQADGSDNPEGRALNRRVEVRLMLLPAGPE